VSRAASAQTGGRVDWVPLAQLPAPVAAAVLPLRPGQVSEPVDLGAFVGIFLLRALDDSPTAAAPPVSIDWAEYLIPGGRTPEALAAAARVRAQVDTCDDLYGLAQDQPQSLIREVRPVGEIPDALRAQLALLDENEVSTVLTSGANLRFVMLCGRVVEPGEGAFETLGQQLLNQRLESYASSFLDELRADAIIE
jgi:peptidyl-prolyl cis-trans isomerase SurA